MVEQTGRVSRDSIRRGTLGLEVYCGVCGLEIGRALVVSYAHDPDWSSERWEWVHVHSGLMHCHPMARPAGDPNDRSWQPSNARKLLARETRRE